MSKRRNVRKLALRPALPRRAIVWFPPFPLESNIERFRAAHDPLAGDIAAHVSLVFPFACNLSSVQLASHVRRIVSKWPPLPVTFRDIEGLLDEFVLLMVRERDSAVTALHDELYTGVLKNHLRTEITYNPHVTIARAPTREDFPAILDSAETQFGAGRGREWRLVLRELAVVTHHPDGTISRDQTVSLNC
jgi:2'-5' RNA ligase